MINNPVIVGCGTIGASLVLKLVERKVISNLKIYDYDTINSINTNSIYPFTFGEQDISKVRIVKFLSRKIHPDLNIQIYDKKVDEPFYTSEFIIDCRDCKIPHIKPNMKLSLDGYLLYVDCRKKQESSENYHKYVYPRNSNCINKAIDVIVEILISDDYTSDNLRLYDLDKGECYVL